MAPSDAELLGGVVPSATPPASGGDPGESKGGAGARSSGPNASGGEDDAASPPAAGGQGASASAGGEAAEDFSSLIPQQGLALWLMADHGVGDFDGGVAVWSDFSLNEADAKQSVPSLQPKVVPGPRDLSLLEFDGVDDQLSLSPGFADFSEGLSAFVIGSELSDQPCSSFLHLSKASEEQDVEVGRLHGALHYEVADDDVWGLQNTFGLDQLYLLGVLHEPSKAPVLRLNGTLMIEGPFTALPVVTARTSNFIGRALYNDCEPLHGRIGEIILYSRALTMDEQAVVQGYLQNKWSYEPPVKVKPGPGELPAAN